jgi:hypothetical protein
MEKLEEKLFTEHRTKKALEEFKGKELSPLSSTILKGLCAGLSIAVLFKSVFLLSFMFMFSSTSYFSLLLLGFICPFILQATLAEDLYYKIIEPLVKTGNKMLFVQEVLKEKAELTEYLDFYKKRVKEEYEKALRKDTHTLSKMEDSLYSLLDINESSTFLPGIRNRTENQINKLELQIEKKRVEIEELREKKSITLHNLDVTKNWVEEEQKLEALSKDSALDLPSLDEGVSDRLENMALDLEGDVQYMLDYKDALDR